MIKKIICFGVVLAMMFSLMGCNQGKKLEEYKATAKTTIETYAESKGEDNYSMNNWIIITVLVKQSKAEIDTANEKVEIDKAIKAGKERIDNVLTVEEMNELENIVKQDYLLAFSQEFWFGRFYGLYNESAVFFIPGDETAIKTAIISGIEFTYTHGWRILIWKDGSFYDLEDIENIIDEGVLVQSDIEWIGAIHVEANN